MSDQWVSSGMPVVEGTLSDVAAAEVVVQHRCLEPLPLALLAGGGDAGHHRQVGVDDAGAVAVGAGALGVGAERDAARS